MKPCKHCNSPKSYHSTFPILYGNHKFEMDNLLWIENQLKAKELKEKHQRLSYCQICKNTRKSPFGICKECSE